MRLSITLVLLCMFSVVFGSTGKGEGEGEVLEVEREGNLVYVVNFKEGDKIKLFEVDSGDHILSKTRGEIDLSQLPVGEYLLENNEGKSVVIRKNALELVVQHSLGTEYMVEQDSKYSKMHRSLNSIQDLENHYIKIEGRLLAVDRQGDIVTVTDFEEGDVIKLFELKDKIHVITKTSDSVDLSQLPSGNYLLENNKGKAVVVEKLGEDMMYTTM